MSAHYGWCSTGASTSRPELPNTSLHIPSWDMNGLASNWILGAECNPLNANHGATVKRAYLDPDV